MNTLLLVTDQPFWRRENGSQQRSWALLQFLKSQGFRATCFYMVPLTDSDILATRELGLQIVAFDPNGSWFAKRVHGIANMFGRRRRKAKRPASQAAGVSKSPPGTLQTYRWPAAAAQFQKLVARLHPDLVLCNYVIWGNLLEAFPSGQRPFLAVVDTQDVLHQRQQSFSRYGADHWIEITRDEEAQALGLFDLILAAQADEAKTLRAMVPEVDVVQVGHDHDRHARPDVIDPQRRLPDAPVRIGMIGSGNAANRDGLRWFIDEVWNNGLSAQNVELLVAGSLSSEMDGPTDSGAPQVRCLGVVQPLDAFYDQVDVVINPIRFGSGIKIKTIEAFRFGKPLVVHPHSTQGLSEAAKEAVLVADTAAEFSAACQRLVDSAAMRREMSQRMLQFDRTELSAKSVYSDLVAWLREHDLCVASGRPA
ncbi:hypothetical protein EC9_01590 [Rosistilla ulvae]|uniref:Glycosyl transferases group 1 n=1 Tax=Rosistilla ulvae TaxID=1930277 RepID=A0A517LTP6_9BACT|nr:glycosyltransferase [Rosistilla ulvae]QDS86001.1 hypothetical protein EC9_01590 [Rosistilla ulvae]